MGEIEIEGSTFMLKLTHDEDKSSVFPSSWWGWSRKRGMGLHFCNSTATSTITSTSTTSSTSTSPRGWKRAEAACQERLVPSLHSHASPPSPFAQHLVLQNATATFVPFVFMQPRHLAFVIICPLDWKRGMSPKWAIWIPSHFRTAWTDNLLFYGGFIGRFCKLSLTHRRYIWICQSCYMYFLPFVKMHEGTLGGGWGGGGR